MARVAYLISQYPAVNHTFILREVRGLRALGMDVQAASVLPPDRTPDKMSAEEVEEAASTFYIRPRGAPAVLKAAARTLASRPAPFFRGLLLAMRTSRGNLITLARHLRYFAEALVTGCWMRDIAAGHLHTHFASTVALFARAVFPIRLSATIHGPSEFDDPLGFLLPEKVHAAELVVAISNYGRSQLMRFSHPADWDKITVVRLGVNSAEFAPVTRLKSPAAPFEIICVGRLAPAKAQHILLQACALVLRNGHRILLRLVGHGPDRHSLEQAAAKLGISSDVIFHGALSHDRVLELYRSADCFALASFAEGVPVVLMEAMALEIPCVATLIMGIPELIESGVEGLLVSPSSAGSLAAAIERIISDNELALRLGESGRAKILRDFEINFNIETLSNTFQVHIPVTKDIRTQAVS